MTKVFATTRWTVIAACQQTDESRAREALAELCQAYWRPVYLCIRHHGHSAHDAQDLTQEFFLRLLNGTWIGHLDQAKGRFRAYLSVTLKHFLHSQWRSRWSWRRGRGVTVVSFEAPEAESSYARLPATLITPETLYERQWAQTVIGHALEQLKIELRADGKEVLLGHFDAILAAGTREFPYQQTADALGLKIGALHAALHRWRKRFRALLREEIVRTVVSKAEIEDELQYLQRLFARDL